MVMLELGGEGWWYGWGFGETGGGGRGLAAGVSHLCQGSGCSGVSSCMRRHSATAARQSALALPILVISFSLFSVTLSLFFFFFTPLFFHSHPLSTLLVLPFLCVAAPPPLLFES